MTQFNPEVTHEARELHMRADDAIAAALQEAFAILNEPAEPQDNTEQEGPRTEQVAD